ncbi:hypothetical protein BDV19DRAFT_392499 [Aspergillus venezuelensis]
MFPLFPNLEEISLVWEGLSSRTDGYNLDGRKVLPFFSHPSLKKITVNKVYNPFPIQSSRVRYSNITDIDIICGKMSSGLLSWLEICRELKSFRMVFGVHRPKFEPSNRPQPGHFQKLLRLHKVSLEEL